MTNIERQKVLYDFLIKQGDRYTYQQDIACELKTNDYWIGYDELCTYGTYHDCTGRKIMGADIREINSSPDFEKIIISNGNGVKIATEEDYDKMIKSLYKAVFAKLKRIRTIEKKAKRNGQITIDKKEIIAFLENDNG